MNKINTVLENLKMTQKQMELDVRADSPKMQVRLSAARHSKTHPNTLDKLSNDSRIEVQIAVANNPHTFSKTLDYLATNSHSDVQTAVANNTSASTKTIDYLIANGYYDTRIAAIFNPNASAEALEKNFYKEVLYRGSKDDNELYETAIALSTRNNLSEDVIDDIIFSNYTQAKINLIENKNISKTQLFKLTLDQDKHIRMYATNALNERNQTSNNLDLSALDSSLKEKLKSWTDDDIANFIIFLKNYKN